jgi:hypothetical protein
MYVTSLFENLGFANLKPVTELNRGMERSAPALPDILDSFTLHCDVNLRKVEVFIFL